MRKKLLFTAYYTVLGGLLLSMLFALYLGDNFDLLTGVVGPLIFAILILAVIGWALVYPNWSKVRWAAAALAFGVAGVLMAPHARIAGVRLFFLLERRAMNTYTQNVLVYGRIRTMSDGTRYFKELNGALVAYTSVEVDTVRAVGLRARVAVDSILRRDQITREHYEAFRTGLQRLHFTSFSVTDDYVAFVSDGFLDNLYGFVYVRPGRPTPAIGTEFVEATQLAELIPMRDGWFYYVTT